MRSRQEFRDSDSRSFGFGSRCLRSNALLGHAHAVNLARLALRSQGQVRAPVLLPCVCRSRFRVCGCLALLCVGLAPACVPVSLPCVGRSRSRVCAGLATRGAVSALAHAVNLALRTQCAGRARTAIFKFARTRGRADSIDVVAVIRVIGTDNIQAAFVAVVGGLIEPAHTRSLQRWLDAARCRGGFRPWRGRQNSTAATAAGLLILGTDRSRSCSGWRRRQLPRPCNTKIASAPSRSHHCIATFVQPLLDSHK